MNSIERRLAMLRDTQPAPAGVLPLIAYYGREADFEARRTAFYEACDRVFQYRYEIGPSLPGRDGREAHIAFIDRHLRAVPLITNAAPLEYLANHGRLESKKDFPNVGTVRFAAGWRLRDIMIGAEVSGMKSANLEGRSGAGGAGRPVSDYKIDCMNTLEWIRNGMPSSLYRKLEAILYEERWLWEKGSPKRQRALLENIHKALDYVSVRLGYMTDAEFIRRWSPEPAPETPAPAASETISSS